jgi:hypothetical protein
VADEHLDDNDTFEDAPAVAEAGEAPVQYGVGPFSIREVALGGVWLVAFIVSFFSISTVRFDSVWTSGLWWILTIGLPTVAVFLIGLRRLSPQGIRRVGSLGIDQFASVAFSVSTVVWITYIWETVAFAIENGVWARSWVIWVEGVLMLAGVVLTVFAPFLPVLGEDFRLRPEIVAHRNARPLRPIAPRPPRPPRPAAPHDAVAPYGAMGAPVDTANPYGSPYGSAYGAAPAGDQAWSHDQGAHTVPVGHYGTDAQPVDHHAEHNAGHNAENSFDPAADHTAERTAAYSTPAAESARHQAFWALAPEERLVVDEAGVPHWTIGPTAWALVIEDRGDVFVMRHEDGRIGYLHDVSDITRG